jgi:hypothetical protein|tara:strand:- start:397 stop:741 length:345 start_codon:yes stop_codon:yes gene_type:complete
MNTAKEINNKLDEILLHQETLIELEKDYNDPDFGLEEEGTGEKVTKEIVLNKAQKIKDQIINDLNKLTNNGQNCRDMFTNQYYINDMLQDKEIAEQNRANKLFSNLDKQIAKEN